MGSACIVIPVNHPVDAHHALWFAGLSVLGVYLYGPDAAFTNATHQLCQILDGMTSGAATAADKLLFISSQSRKLLCKQRSLGTASSAALPVCEFRLGPMLSGFSIMTCRSGFSYQNGVLCSGADS